MDLDNFTPHYLCAGALRLGLPGFGWLIMEDLLLNVTECGPLLRQWAKPEQQPRKSNMVRRRSRATRKL